jgi:ABC-type dipeptide/oligopeptide/nickel transport system ATPase component
MVGIAGSSGSGKTSFAVEIVSFLDLPWVVILSMVQAATLCIPRVSNLRSGLIL